MTMGKRIGKPLTSLGTGAGLVVEKTVRIETVGEETTIEEEVMERINEGLIVQFRKELGYLGVETDWVRMRTALKRYTVRMGPAFLHFPVVLNCMKDLAKAGYVKCMMSFLELADQTPMAADEMKKFVSKFLAMGKPDPKKTPDAILNSMAGIGPDSWQEAIWYLDLMVVANLSMAEEMVAYMEKLEGRHESSRQFLLQVAKTGRMTAVDSFMDLLPLMEKAHEDIGKEMKPILDFIKEKQFAEAEMLMVALVQSYGLVEAIVGEDRTAIFSN